MRFVTSAGLPAGTVLKIVVAHPMAHVTRDTRFSFGRAIVHQDDFAFRPIAAGLRAIRHEE
jgi:hypothetical protein